MSRIIKKQSRFTSFFIVVAVLAILINIFQYIILKRTLAELETANSLYYAESAGISLDSPINDEFGDLNGGWHTIDEGLDLAVNGIEAATLTSDKEQYLAVVDLAVRNETGEEHRLTKRNLFLEDPDGNYYPVRNPDTSVEDPNPRLFAYSIFNDEFLFELPQQEDSFDGWRTVYETDDDGTEVEIMNTEEEYTAPIEEEEEEEDQPITYGKGHGGIHTIEDNITLSVHSIKTSRVPGLTAVTLTVKNDSDSSYSLDQNKMHLEDSDGNTYPVSLYDEDYSIVEIAPYDFYEVQQGFTIPKDYWGEYDGWMLVFEGGEETIYANVEPL